MVTQYSSSTPAAPAISTPKLLINVLLSNVKCSNTKAWFRFVRTLGLMNLATSNGCSRHQQPASRHSILRTFCGRQQWTLETLLLSVCSDTAIAAAVLWLWWVLFVQLRDGNLSKLWAVCVLCRLRAADPRTKPDHFWGIKFPNILPTPRLTSLNVLDTIFIISNIDLNKNWTREMISCWCFPTASPFLIHAGSGSSRQQARVKFWLIGVIINSQEMLGATTSRNWAQSPL